MNETNEQKNIQDKLGKCEQLRDEYLAGWQRAKADFLNYQKQEQEKFDWLKKQLDANWLLLILEFYDNLERAQSSLPQEIAKNDWVKGVLASKEKFFAELAKQGLLEIKALGEKFNPEIHEAVSETEGAGDPGAVGEVVEKGYMLNGDLLRAVKVKIIK